MIYMMHTYQPTKDGSEARISGNYSVDLSSVVSIEIDDKVIMIGSTSCRFVHFLFESGYTTSVRQPYNVPEDIRSRWMKARTK